MNYSNIESAKFTHSPPSYKPTVPSYPKKTILIKQLEILQLPRRGIAVLICPFEDKEVTTKVMYEPRPKLFVALLTFLFCSLSSIFALGAFEAYYTIFLLLLFIFPTVVLIVQYSPYYDQIHRCPSCNRVVAVAKQVGGWAEYNSVRCLNE